MPAGMMTFVALFLALYVYVCVCVCVCVVHSLESVLSARERFVVRCRTRAANRSVLMVSSRWTSSGHTLAIMTVCVTYDIQHITYCAMRMLPLFSFHANSHARSHAP